MEELRHCLAWIGMAEALLSTEEDGKGKAKICHAPVESSHGAYRIGEARVSIGKG